MLGRLFCVGLSVATLAMLLFVAGFVLHQLGFGLLTGLLYLLAEKILLLAFAFLVVLIVFGLGKAIWRDLSAYFNREAAVLRRLLSLRARQLELQQFQTLKSRQLNYLVLYRRQRLLAADNRKQASALFDSISRELQVVKAQLPKSTYQDFSRKLRRHKKRADAAAMLALRQQIPCP